MDGQTHRLIIRSPILLVDSRLMLSPSDSSLSFSLLAERRCEPCSGLGVRGADPSAGCTWTTGIGVSLLASELAFWLLMANVRPRGAW